MKSKKHFIESPVLQNSWKFNITVIPIAYLENGRVEKYLSSDSRYDVRTVSLDDFHSFPGGWKDTDLIITEVSDEYQMGEILRHRQYERKPVIVAVTKDGLRDYIASAPHFTRPYIILPIDKWDILGRVSMALGINALPLEKHMTRIDGTLAIDFELGHVLKGRNKYFTLVESHRILIKYMFDNVNRWIHVSELAKLPSFPENAGRKAVSRMISMLRTMLEENRTCPRRLLSTKNGYYMLHSNRNPQVDPIVGWGEIQKQAKETRGRRVDRNRIYR